ncbi:MAG: thioesterase family protein [Acidimicrobiia bacterium]|jgi:acyl-CoA thioester hydrolase
MPFEVPDDREIHTTSIRVRFYELDPYDHVNHTNYFAYFETARIDYLEDMGWGLHRLKGEGWQFVVVEIHARFLASARFGEELTIHTWIEEVTRVKSTWKQVMLRGEQKLAELTVSAAFTDSAGKPRRIPEAFVSYLDGLRG